MPLPGVILGLPWLASVIGSLFTAFIGWLAIYMTKRVAIMLAVIAAFVSLTVALIAVIEGLVAGFTYAFPVAANFGFLIPADLSALLAAYFTARLAHWVYGWNVRIVQTRLF